MNAIVVADVSRSMNELVSKLEALTKKYETTFAEVETQISETEKVLSAMIDDLEGNEFDMLGLSEFKKMLGGDEHASQKAQPNQYQRQLKGAMGAGQQCPAQSIKKALPPQSGHDRHQGKQDRQRAQVDVAEILRIRQNKEGGDNGQHSGCGEDRFLLNELFEFHRDTSL